MSLQWARGAVQLPWEVCRVQSCWGSSEKRQAPGSEDRLTTHKDRWRQTDRSRFQSGLFIACVGASESKC